MLKATEQMSWSAPLHCGPSTIPEVPCPPHHLPCVPSETPVSVPYESLGKRRIIFYWFDQICVHIIYMHIHMLIYIQRIFLSVING